jgi:spoIIIJ-associated protein
MNSVEIEADDVEGAIAQALNQLGIDREMAEIGILADASRGLFGLGGRKARVRVARRDTVVEPAPAPATDAADGAADDFYHPAEPLDDATVERARAVLEQIVALTGIDASVAARNDVDHATLDLDGDTSGLLIGRKGQMLDALEYVVSRIVGKDSGRSIHVTVDSQGYRARRQASLEEMAMRMSQEARRRRRPVRLPDLTSRERRIVHMVLRDQRGITTRSSGEGDERTLVILPSEGHGRYRDE